MSRKGAQKGCVKALSESRAPSIFEACGLAEREKSKNSHSGRLYGFLAEFSHSLGG
jgi:hypothetical protein